MYIHEATYLPEELLKENLHIHTNFSRCAKPEMLLPSIIKKAEKAKLQRIAIVDHYNNDINEEIYISHISTLRAELKSIKTDVEVLFGAELSAYGVGKWLDGTAVRKVLDYKLYACNHYHAKFWEQPTERTAEGYARHMIDVASAVISSAHADCIAHPFDPGFIRADINKPDVVNSITDDMLADVFELAKKYETAIEINNATANYYGLQRRVFDVGKEVGVTFNYGTDAHELVNIDTFSHIKEVRKVLLG